jgi:hypothetical protein
MREEFEPAAQPDELGAHRPDRHAVILAEFGNRLEVRGEPPGQPHQPDIALRFVSQPPARLNAIEIAVEVDLQKRRGMIGRPACRRRRHPRKEGGQVQFVDQDLDHPNRVLLVDVILQAMRQQRRLHPVFALNAPMHRQPQALKLRDSKADLLRAESDSTKISGRCHTAWTRSCPRGARPPG